MRMSALPLVLKSETKIAGLYPQNRRRAQSYEAVKWVSQVDYAQKKFGKFKKPMVSTSEDQHYLLFGRVRC